MKKYLLWLLIGVASLSLMACGNNTGDLVDEPTVVEKEQVVADSKPSDAPTPKPVAEEENIEITPVVEEKKVVITSLIGGWECVDALLDDNGYKASSDELVKLYDMELKDLFTLRAYGNGTVDVTLFGDGATVNWEEGEDGFLIYVDEEPVIASLKDNKLYVTMEESYTADGNEVKSVMSFVLERVESFAAVSVDYDVIYDKQATRKMSTFMNSGIYLETDGYLYGLYNGGGFGYAKVSVENGKVVIADGKMISDDDIAYYLCDDASYVYCTLNLYTESTERGIYRVKKGTDDLEMIYDGEVVYLQIYDGKLYFTDSTHGFCSMNTDGTQKEKIIDKDVYFTYIIDKDWVLFQDDADGETIHLFNRNTNEECKVTDKQSYCPTIYDEYLYYYCPTENENALDDYSVARVNLYSGIKEEATWTNEGSFYLDGERIHFYDYGCPSLPIDEWNTMNSASGILGRMYYVNDDYTILRSSDHGKKLAGVVSDLKHENTVDMLIP